MHKRLPYPVGPLATELINIIYDEIKLFGTQYRKKIREELPEVDYISRYELN
jgi:hypothetical protein